MIIVEGIRERSIFYPENVQEHIESFINQGCGEKDAMKLVAKERGVAKSEIYNQVKRK
ncbi:MAG: hypothetical protein FWD97_00125 [Defluviitaleaceae bacterium]|nr:hypothetical protein [Defluviitaleaceae bacterium]